MIKYMNIYIWKKEGGSSKAEGRRQEAGGNILLSPSLPAFPACYFESKLD
jgi:hypothetical protein